MKHKPVLMYSLLLTLLSGGVILSFAWGGWDGLPQTARFSVIQELDKQKSETDTLGQAASPDTLQLQIGFVGDIMAHLTQINAQRQEDGSYDFKNNYVWVKPLFEANDLMIGNLETTFAGEALGYSAYPRFNTPDALAQALAYAGFDVLTTANNHMYDTGLRGMLRTIDIVKAQGLIPTGSQKDLNEAKHHIIVRNGIKVGIAAYTYESGRAGNLVTINGIAVSKGDEQLLNSFDPSDIQASVDRFRAMIAAMRRDSAEVLLFVMHWGDEYQTKPNTYQRVLADSLNKLGVDLIFGSHPHVVQPTEYLLDPRRNHTTYVAYSTGNFISNQRFETLDNYNTEDGLYVEVVLHKIGSEPARVRAVREYPTWVRRASVNGRYRYEVVPLEQVLADTAALRSFSASEQERMRQSLKRTRERITGW